MSLISKEELLKKQNDREIVKKTSDQVIKDFARFGIDLEFPKDLNLAYDGLFDQLSSVIFKMLENNTTQLYSLLYTIDLSEFSVRKGVEEMNDLSLNDVITHLILERELKKVLTREYIKNHGI